MEVKLKDFEDVEFQGSIRARLVRGITWNVVGTMFSQGSTFLCNIIIANILGRAVFGEFGMIQNTILTVAGVAQLAAGYAATKFVAEFCLTDKEKTGRILGLCSFVTGVMGGGASLVMFVCSHWLAVNTLNAPHLSMSLCIASGSILFCVLNGYQLGALAGLESYEVIARSGAFHGVLHLIICSIASWLWGLNGALAGFIASAFLRWTIFHRALVLASASRNISLTFKGIWNERDIILNFALPAALSGFISMPVLWLVNTILVKQPGGYSQMGLYCAANSLKSIILFLPQMINNVGMSLMNNQRGLGDSNNYQKIFWLNLKLTVCVVLIGVLLSAFSGSWILRIFGKDFIDGHMILLVLAISTIPESLALTTYQIIQAQGKMWLSFYAVVLPRDCANMIASYLLVPFLGATGMALAYTFSQIVSLLCIITIVKRIGVHGLSVNPTLVHIDDL